MRSLSLTVVLAVSLFAALGFAQTSYDDFSAHGWAARRLDASDARRIASRDGSADYIVRFADAPTAGYRGGVPGYAPTNPRVTGARYLDLSAPAAQSYEAYLVGRQDQMLRSAGKLLGRSLTPRFTYLHALDGMSLRLDRAEAMSLARLPGVLSVTLVRHDRLLTGIPASATDTNASRAWIGAPSAWALPTYNRTDNEGEGVVIADVDTGINHANSSFAATGPRDGYSASDPGGLRFGVCDPGNAAQSALEPPFFACNDKLIGAYTYTQGTGNDPDSPEDSEGHGSHTASTMAGDFTDTAVNGVTTPLSGVAPHASLIVYDVCDPTDFCRTDAILSALDQAVADQSKLAQTWGASFKGMALNYSIGGSDDPYNDPVQQAFLSASDAGIFVAAAGGNGGPANAASNDPVNFPLYPVENTGPWLSTVAAATHSGTFTGDDLGGFSGGDARTRPATTLPGAGDDGGLGPANIVYAGTSNYSGTDPVITGTAPTSQSAYPPSTGDPQTDAAECFYPFDANTFPAGSIVVCDRGTTPLVDKAYNVEQGGAAGVVIATTATSNQDLATEAYVIPGTLIGQQEGDVLRTWLDASFAGVSSGTAEARLSGAALTTDPSHADQVAGFSSRAPTGTALDSLLKPDLTAPGVSVLAALADPQYSAACTSGCTSRPETFGFLDGTSMAAPHVTGAAALLKQLHPDWDPAEIKSALMLTALTGAAGLSPGLSDQCASLDTSLNCVASSSLPSPQVRGAGRIDLDAASRTGLVMGEIGRGYADADPGKGGDLTSLNLPSMADAHCAGSCGWIRNLKSAMSSASVAYSVTVRRVSPGLQVNVSPTIFTLAPGASQSLTVTADDPGVTQGTWAFAEVDITTAAKGDGGETIPAMHLPLAVKAGAPVALMSLNQTSLAYSQADGGSSQRQFTISNKGRLALEWSLTASGGMSMAASAAGMRASAPPLATGPVWSQPGNDSDSGYPSTFYASSGHGLYAADRFDLPIQASVSGIEADGFAQDGSGPVAVTGAVDWYLYADSGGRPKGDPEDGKNGYVWHYRAKATDPGVSIGNGSITLDLGKAGQGDIALAAGKYWLMVVPVMNSGIADSQGASWYWFEGISPDGQKLGSIIDPSDALGHGAAWQALSVSFAFTLSGSYDCTGQGIPGLSFSNTSGTIAAGGSEDVTATFDAGTLAAGTYGGAVCVSSNASDHPLTVLPVTADVIAASGSSRGGGSGGAGLLELALWALLARRKLMVH